MHARWYGSTALKQKGLVQTCSRHRFMYTLNNSIDSQLNQPWGTFCNNIHQKLNICTGDGTVRLPLKQKKLKPTCSRHQILCTLTRSFLLMFRLRCTLTPFKEGALICQLCYHHISISKCTLQLCL